MLKQLKVLFEHSQTFDLYLKILFLIVQIRLGKKQTDPLSLKHWKECANYIMLIIKLVETQKDKITIKENSELTISSEKNTSKVSKVDENGKPIVEVFGSLSFFIERLDEEFIKSLQNSDPHRTDYFIRSRDEDIIIGLGNKALSFYRKFMKFDESSIQIFRIKMRILEHIYIRNDKFHIKILKRQNQTMKKLEQNNIDLIKSKSFLPSVSNWFSEEINNNEIYENNENLTICLENFSKYFYKYGQQSDKVKVLLLNIYSNAVNLRYFIARDMLILSRVQDSINSETVFNQVYYNRAIAQLSICAFKLGFFEECYEIVYDLVSSQKSKELLAQGMSNKYGNKKYDLNQKKQFPFHMQINIDKLDAIFFICSILSEIPRVAKHKVEGQKNSICKPLYNLLNHYEKNSKYIFMGVPENTKDHIYLAVKGLQKGNWEKCYKYLSQLKMWKIMKNASKILEILKHKIKIEALKIYLFKFSNYYDTIGLDYLTSMFQLSKQEIHSVVSQMILNDEFQASWDHSDSNMKTIVIYHTQESKLQELCFQMIEKLEEFTENNETLFDLKIGKTNQFKRDQGKYGKKYKNYGSHSNYSHKYQNRKNQNRSGGYRNDRGDRDRDRDKNQKNRKSQNRYRSNKST